MDNHTALTVAVIALALFMLWIAYRVSIMERNQSEMLTYLRIDRELRLAAKNHTLPRSKPDEPA